MDQYKLDFIIFGGGIAGLWILNNLRNQGFSAILLENNKLGSGQSIKAQGIIHGGLKYSLQGKISDATLSIQDMPKLWDEYLKNQNQDLILAKNYNFWVPNKILGKISQNILSQKSKLINFSEYPSCLQHADFKGQVYSVPELVLNMPNLLKNLWENHKKFCFKIDQNKLNILYSQNNNQDYIQEINYDNIKIKSKYYIFTAGKNNIDLLKFMQNPPKMQLRPLHMVLAKMPEENLLYAHCLGLSSVPRLSITTHRCADGDWVWYLGGGIAESGINLSSEEQIKLAKSEIKKLFPFIDITNWKWASFMIDRAEQQTNNLLKPDGPYLGIAQNILCLWPTKFTLLPALMFQLNNFLENKILIKNLNKTDNNLDYLNKINNFKLAELSKPIWDEIDYV